MTKNPTRIRVLSKVVFDRVQGNFIVLYLAEGLGGDVPGDKDFATIDSFEQGEFSLNDGSELSAIHRGCNAEPLGFEDR